MSFQGKTVKAIVAMDEERAIGRNGSLPWHVPEDLKRFSQLTKGHAVLMGRTTWESLPAKVRPLPERFNIVLSRSAYNASSSQGFAGAHAVFNSIDGFGEALAQGSCSLPSETLWIIGGAQVYTSTIQYWDEVYVTKVLGTHQGDTFLYPFEENFICDTVQSFPTFSFLNYRARSRE